MPCDRYIIFNLKVVRVFKGDFATCGQLLGLTSLLISLSGVPVGRVQPMIKEDRLGYSPSSYIQAIYPYGIGAAAAAAYHNTPYTTMAAAAAAGIWPGAAPDSSVGARTAAVAGAGHGRKFE